MAKHTNDPNTFPSLFARLTPASVDGAQGFSVQCTATTQPLGVVFWTCATVVTWHWRTASGVRGACTTKRNAVQALRDQQNATTHTAPLTFDEPAFVDTPARVVRASASPVVVATEAPVAARRIVWGDDSQSPDLTAALAAAFVKHDGRRS